MLKLVIGPSRCRRAWANRMHCTGGCGVAATMNPEMKRPRARNRATSPTWEPSYQSNLLSRPRSTGLGPTAASSRQARLSPKYPLLGGKPETCPSNPGTHPGRPASTSYSDSHMRVSPTTSPSCPCRQEPGPCSNFFLPSPSTSRRPTAGARTVVMTVPLQPPSCPCVIIRRPSQPKRRLSPSPMM
jgi:hypothetical protein